MHLGPLGMDCRYSWGGGVVDAGGPRFAVFCFAVSLCFLFDVLV